MPEVLVNLAISIGFFVAVGVAVAMVMRRCADSSQGTRDDALFRFQDEPTD